MKKGPRPALALALAFLPMRAENSVGYPGATGTSGARPAASASAARRLIGFRTTASSDDIAQVHLSRRARLQDHHRETLLAAPGRSRMPSPPLRHNWPLGGLSDDFCAPCWSVTPEYRLTG